MTKSATHLDDLLCFEVYAAQHAFNKVYKPLLDPLGLTYPQYLVAVLLWEQDSRSIGEIGTALGLETNTLTPLVKRMEKSGLVRRQRDPEDERRVKVTLTDQGRALRNRAEEVHACAAQMTGLSLSELAALRDQIRSLRIAIQNQPTAQ